MDNVSSIDIEIIESIRRVFSITKQLPPISSMYLLKQISMADGSSQQDLAEAVRMKPQSVSEHLKKMETSGWIVRTPSKNDKRVSLVSITDEGRQRVEGSSDLFQTYSDAFLSDFDMSEKEELARLLRKMIDTNEGGRNHISPAPQTHKGSDAVRAGAPEAPKTLDTEKGMICTCKGRRCIITWDDSGKIDGYFCKIGYEGAVETMMRNQK